MRIAVRRPVFFSFFGSTLRMALVGVCVFGVPLVAIDYSASQATAAKRKNKNKD
jgi:hypothetical protein